jgi:hypothetical protein
MALIKCTECGQEISTEATSCPHCGKPLVHVNPITINEADPSVPKKGTAKAIVGFIILGLIFFTFYFVTRASSSYSGPGTFIGNLNQDLNRGDFKKVFNDIFSSGPTSKSSQTPSASVKTNSGTQVTLQEVKNLGYDFYLGEIETSGTTNINDDLKNQITKVAYTAQFPTSLLKTVPIIILNNLALTGDQYISVPSGNLKVPDLKGEWLSEGGIYVTFSSGAAVIFINKPIIAQGRFTEVLTHELGHAVGSKLTDQEWTKFYSLRGIPTGTVRHGTNWNLSPEEDFAEVYKNIFTGIAVRTFYGQLTPSIGDIDMGSCMSVYMDAQNRYTPKSETDPNDPSAWLKAMQNPPKVDYAAVSSQANADAKVQACRKDVMMNQAAHQSDWAYGVPYKSNVGPATKTFVQGIVTQLNQNK